MIKLSKQAIKKLLQAEPEVKLCNGCFNIVTAKAVFSKYNVELQVHVTHPALIWQCGNKNEVNIILWKQSQGEIFDVSPELFPKIEEMKLLGTMTDEHAKKLSQENAKAFQSTLKLLGHA